MEVRAQFIQKGVLSNTQDTNFRVISDNWPIFAFAHDLGNVTNATAPVVFAVGHIRDPAIEYVTIDGMQNRSLFFWSQYSSAADLVRWPYWINLIRD